MNPFTALVWDVIQDSPEFLEQLTAIMKRDYKPFLSGEKAFQANAKALEGRNWINGTNGFLTRLSTALAAG